MSDNLIRVRGAKALAESLGKLEHLTALDLSCALGGVGVLRAWVLGVCACDRVVTRSGLVACVDGCDQTTGLARRPRWHWLERSAISCG